MKLLYVLIGVLLGMNVFAQSAPPVWPSEAVDLFATMPVQDSGRVKPLDTVARFTLLRLNGKRTLTMEQGGTRSAIEWLMDCLFVPEAASEYRCFSVEAYEVIVALGLEPHGKKRDRYSYRELLPGIDRLMQLARDASNKPQEQRDYIDQHLITLANNVLAYESLIGFADFARVPFHVSGNALLEGAFPGRDVVRTSDVVATLPGHLRDIVARADSMDDEERERIALGMNDVFETLDGIATSGRLFSLFPPSREEKRTWRSPGDVLENAFDAEYDGVPPLHFIAEFEALMDALPNLAAFSARARTLHDLVVGAAESRGEYRRVPLEVTYYRARLLFFAQWLFVLAFALTACAWMLPQTGRLSLAINFALLPPIALLTAGITLRCIIRGRPPVTTLYETILFTALVAALLGFLIEFPHRKRIAMSVGAALGALGMFFAWRYEAREGMDTMPAVIAVLDTNFWLATHVTTIIVGYGAGLFASALAHVYVLARWFGMRRQSPRFFTDLGRVIYGVTAFCLVFTLIGTVLGGVWAAQSWGRFWGWDPKENGALLIVLWALAVFHARRGGYMRHGGVAISAIVLGMIVVFAWWGVNALGVGLHSYGFISGVWSALTVFWLVEGLFLMAGAVALVVRPLQTDAAG